LKRRPRRRRSLAAKLAIIRECLEPGASLAGVALAHGANANMVRKWVVKYQQGGYGPLPAAMPAMLPVVVKQSMPTRRSRGNVPALPVIEIELRRGVVRVHGADPRLLQALIDTLSA
jgi:transposase-like protein